MKSIGRKRGMCEWDGFSEAAPHLRGIMARGESGRLAPFHLLSEPGVTAAEQRACSELWIRDRLVAARPQRAGLDFRFDHGARDKIRLGYLSSDFHDHATALLLVETLETHDRARFDVRGYSYGADDGRAMRKRLEKTFDAFSDVQSLTDVEAACAIHRDGVDILVDLKGYTRDARTGILLLRPAPVQVNYLGYPGTLGAGVCDYIVTDRFMTPPACAADYSEILRLHAEFLSAAWPRRAAWRKARPRGNGAAGDRFCVLQLQPTL